MSGSDEAARPSPSAGRSPAVGVGRSAASARPGHRRDRGRFLSRSPALAHGGEAMNVGRPGNHSCKEHIVQRVLPRVVMLTVLVVACSTPALAADARSWSASIGFGAVDQDAIGGAPTISLELERHLGAAVSLGLRSGYFTKDDSGGGERDTLYAVAFVRARWPRAGVEPFLEGGGGRYEFEGHPQEGWFGGVGADFTLTARWGLLLAVRYHSVPRPPAGALPDFAEVQAAAHFNF